MPAHPETSKLTYEDYCTLPDDGRRHEVVGGEHFMSPSPGAAHQRVSMVLSRLLGGHVAEHGLGEVFAAPFDVVLSRFDVVQPDLLLVPSARAAIVTAANVQGAPDLVVEILSESSRRHDAVRKRKLYQRAGVEELWLVDPEVETVTVWRREGEVLARQTELLAESGDVLASPLLPGLAMPLAALFSGPATAC